MKDRAWCSEIRVRYAETDQMGVVYHANYLVWCEVGRTDFMREIGASYAHMERDGISLAVTDASVRFLAPARYDDLICIETSLTDLKSRTITFEYLVRHAETGRRLATARTTLVSIDPKGRVTAIPPALREQLHRALA
jgi:acyl-CoA thioester hydrolase